MAPNNVTIKDVYNLIEKLRNDIKETYVTQVEFNPVRNIVYGFVGLGMTAIVVSLLSLLIRSKLAM